MVNDSIGKIARVVDRLKIFNNAQGVGSRPFKSNPEPSSLRGEIWRATVPEFRREDN
jgi:hypothetical protein